MPKVTPDALSIGWESSPVSYRADTAEEIAALALDRIEDECQRSGAEPREACLLAVVELLGALLAYGAWSSEDELLDFVQRAAGTRAMQLEAENDANEPRPPLDAHRFCWTRVH